MCSRRGFTLMEMIVVLSIIAVAAVFVLPNFTTHTEQTRALNVQNNLLAIYSAEHNYNNNHGSYCINSGTNPTCADTIADINANLSLNIQDDGTYTYACVGPPPTGTTPACTATRVNGSQSFSIQLTLNAPINLTGEVNPSCAPSTSNWCP